MMRFNPSKNKGRGESNTATGSANATGNQTICNLKSCSRNCTCWQKWILDPGGNTVLIWKRAFLISCVASHCVDPLFFFLLNVESTYPCMKIDHHVAIVLTYFRTLIDMFFMVHIATRFFTAYIDPVSMVLGKGELVRDPKRIAHRYIRSNFFIDLAAALPVPQILVWAILPSLSFEHIDTSLFFIILVQSAVRLYIVIQVSVDIINTVGFFAKSGWNGSIYNLFLYLVASHVVGSIYYLLAIGR
ncbi:unnamed protein product [Urochloa humidicola]